MLHTPIIKYIFDIYLGIICIAEGKNGKEHMEGLKTVKLSTTVVTLLYSTLFDNLSDNLSVNSYSLSLNSKIFLSFKYFSISVFQ